MSRVDFYVLQQTGASVREQFGCRLTGKAYALQHTVHVRTESEKHAELGDQLLWTFDDSAFVPHDMWRGGEREAPVTIASADVDPPVDTDVIVNLANSVVTGGRWRIAEVLCADPDVRAAGRQRFANYRDAGHDMDTHKL